MQTDWISPFWQAFSMPTHSRVCGIPVPPLSVWHVFALEHIGNAYMVGGEATLGEAVELLVVATQKRAGFLNMYGNPRAIKRKTRSIQRRVVWSSWRGRHNAITECREYSEQSMRVAGRWMKNGAKPCAVPHSLHVLAAAVKFGVNLDSAWDMPYIEARAMFDVLAEQRGDTSIQNAVEQQIDERIAAEMEAENG